MIALTELSLETSVSDMGDVASVDKDRVGKNGHVTDGVDENGHCTDRIENGQGDGEDGDLAGQLFQVGNTLLK